MTDRTCTLSDETGTCTKPVIARGWCGMHYQRWRMTGSAGLAARMTVRHDPQADRKSCARCKVLKPKAEGFFREPRHSDGYAAMCKDCVCAQQQRYRLRRKYGLTPDELSSMQDSQSGLCSICRREPDHRGLVVDHCHDSGKVRKLLCHHCNTLLGMASDNIETLYSAIRYLETHK